MVIKELLMLHWALSHRTDYCARLFDEARGGGQFDQALESRKQELYASLRANVILLDI